MNRFLNLAFVYIFFGPSVRSLEQTVFHSVCMITSISPQVMGLRFCNEACLIAEQLWPSDKAPEIAKENLTLLQVGAELKQVDFLINMAWSRPCEYALASSYFLQLTPINLIE